MKYNYRHAAVTVCHQLKVQSLQGEQMSFVVSISSVSLGWQDGDYKVGFKSLPSASATDSEMTTIKNQTLICKLSVYHYWHVCNNCSRSPEEHPLQGRGPESRVTDHSSLTTQVATFHETFPSLFLGHTVYKEIYYVGVEWQK